MWNHADVQNNPQYSKQSTVHDVQLDDHEQTGWHSLQLDL